jgi:hypothetical protein
LIKDNHLVGSLVARLIIQPSSSTVNTDRNQKVFTLVNAVAQVGGLLGLLVAVQTFLFGFRPQSPWGIIHHWLFGRLRMKLTDQLADYFGQTRIPVSFVNLLVVRH